MLVRSSLKVACLVWIVAVAGCLASEHAASPGRRGSRGTHPTAEPARFPPARLTPVVDARDLGARGDDGVDDTLAIQAAIDLAATTPGTTVLLPAGVLRVSDREPIDSIALRVHDAAAVRIVGAGEDATRIELHSDGDAHVISFSSCVDVGIEALSIDGARAHHRLGHGIRVADTEGLTIRNVTIRHAAHYGIGLQRGALRSIRIEYVAVDDTGGDGIDFKNTASANADIVIRDVTVSRPGQVAARQAGIDVRGPTVLERIVVRGVPAGGVGVRFREDGPVNGPGAHGSVLTDFAVTAGSDSVGVVVAANDVRLARGVVVGGWAGVHALGERATLSRVEVLDAARYGFRVAESASGVHIEEIASRRGRSGLWLEDPDARVHHCRFLESTDCAICVQPSAIGAHLESNDLSPGGGGASTPPQSVE